MYEFENHANISQLHYIKSNKTVKLVYAVCHILCQFLLSYCFVLLLCATLYACCATCLDSNLVLKGKFFLVSVTHKLYSISHPCWILHQGKM